MNEELITKEYEKIIREQKKAEKEYKKKEKLEKMLLRICHEKRCPECKKNLKHKEEVFSYSIGYNLHTAIREFYIVCKCGFEYFSSDKKAYNQVIREIELEKIAEEEKY